MVDPALAPWRTEKAKEVRERRERGGRQAALGCLIIYQLTITAPMWLLLLHEILAAIEARDFLWWVYWTYVPAHIFGHLGFGFARLVVGPSDAS